MKNKITIAIPCYNVENYIRQTIRSVLNQTYKNFSLIIVDNSSRDKTLKIAKEFKDKRIKIYQNKKNIGMFQNMNKCIELTKTPYLKILCADDLIEVDLLEKHMIILEKYPGVNLVYSASKIVNRNNKIMFIRKYFKKNKKINGGVLINLILKSGRNPIGEPSNVTLRVSVLKKYNFKFNINFKYISDLDLWINVLKYGDAYYINSPLSSFRIHNTSNTVSLFKKAVKEHSNLISIYSDEFNLNLLDIIFINIKLYLNMIIKSFLMKFI